MLPISLKGALFMVKQVLSTIFIVAVVGNVSRHGLCIDVRHRNQSNKSKLMLYNSLLSH